MKMYINGQWIDKAETIPVFNPFDQSLLDTVPRGTSADVELAITSAVRGAVAMGKLTSFERYSILRRTADIMAERAEDLGQTITKEEGKVIAEGRGEVQRAIQTITGSAEEAKRGRDREHDASNSIVSELAGDRGKRSLVVALVVVDLLLLAAPILRQLRRPEHQEQQDSEVRDEEDRQEPRGCGLRPPVARHEDDREDTDRDIDRHERDDDHERQSCDACRVIRAVHAHILSG